MPLDEFAREFIFVTAGMHRTTFNPSDDFRAEEMWHMLTTTTLRVFTRRWVTPRQWRRIVWRSGRKPSYKSLPKFCKILEQYKPTHLSPRPPDRHDGRSEEVFIGTIQKKVADKTYSYAWLVENQRVGGYIRQRLILNHDGLVSLAFIFPGRLNRPLMCMNSTVRWKRFIPGLRDLFSQDFCITTTRIGYASRYIGILLYLLERVIEIVRRRDDVNGFEVLPRSWIVERTFGWFCRYRRLSKGYEYLTDSSEATIYPAMTHIMVRRLEPNAQPAGP